MGSGIVEMKGPEEGGEDRPLKRGEERGMETCRDPPSNGRDDKRLTGLYPKPLEGERIPISFLGAEKRRIGWSPEEGKSVPIDGEADVSSLKRVREINEVAIFNWLSGREGLIELSDQEMEGMLAVIEAKNGEQLVYSRERVKGRYRPKFDLEVGREPRRWLLSERLKE
ncbi:MAG TPA: hypothetical protein PLZ42_05395 [Methanothrix sp.]|mgnify:CR=1 FL=1|nr:hypothetical protein [Methanothrix sp.]